jgi:cobalamin biosynthesis protein CobT
MLAFTEYGADTFIGVVKEYDEQSNDEKIIENFAKASCFMSANADGDAILWAYNRLKNREQKRKILIVISDGQPAASRHGDCLEWTKKVVAQIEGEKQVEIYAVGIMNDNVKEIYSESVVINRPSELEAAILNLIKRSLF